MRLEVVSKFCPSRPLRLRPSGATTTNNVNRRERHVKNYSGQDRPPRLLRTLTVELTRHRFHLLGRIFRVELAKDKCQIRLVRISRHRAIRHRLHVLPTSRISPVSVMESRFKQRGALTGEALTTALQPSRRK